MWMILQKQLRLGADERARCNELIIDYRHEAHSS